MKNKKRKFEDENQNIFLANKNQKTYHEKEKIFDEITEKIENLEIHDKKQEIINQLTEKIEKLEIKLKVKCNQIETLKYKLEHNSIPDYIS